MTYRYSEEWLTARRGARVYIRVPTEGTEGKAGGAGGKKCEHDLVLEKDRERIKRDEARTVGAVTADRTAGSDLPDARPGGGATIFPTSAVLRIGRFDGRL